MDSTHELMMSRAIELAQKGLGTVSPNPLVGCVLVADGEIIGEGFHQKYGGPHAEVEAMNSVTPENIKKLSSATMYVTLEPCCHSGKTPPCTDLILKHKIPKVYVACTDPYPKVAGNGIAKLRNEGVEVHTGLLAEKAAFINRRFMTFYEKNRPYIILKWAESLNGKMGISKGEQIKISGKESQMLSHQWRSQEDAILIGRGTLENDNPELTNRLWDGKVPVKIVLAGNAKLSHDLKIFDSKTKVLLFGTQKPDFQFNGKWFYQETENLETIMATLFQEEIQSVIIEGGSKILNSFWNQGLADEIRVFKSKTKILPENAVSAPEIHFKTDSETVLENDKLMIAYR